MIAVHTFAHSWFDPVPGMAATLGLDPNPAAVPAATPSRRVCAIRLVDRRTGSVHRVNGVPLTILSHDPEQAARVLMKQRDPAVWDVRVDPLGPEIESAMIAPAKIASE